MDRFYFYRACFWFAFGGISMAVLIVSGMSRIY